MFTYDDGSFILYRYVKDSNRPDHVKVYTRGEYTKLTDVVSGEIYEVEQFEAWEGPMRQKYNVADVVLIPGVFESLNGVKVNSG